MPNDISCVSGSAEYALWRWSSVACARCWRRRCSASTSCWRRSLSCASHDWICLCRESIIGSISIVLVVRGGVGELLITPIRNGLGLVNDLMTKLYIGHVGHVFLSCPKTGAGICTAVKGVFE